MLEKYNSTLSGEVQLKAGQLKIAGIVARLDTTVPLPRGVKDGDRVTAQGRYVVHRRNGRVTNKYFLILSISQ